MEKEDLILRTLANIQTQMDQRFDQMQGQINQLQTDVTEIKERQIGMENEHGTKLKAFSDFIDVQREFNDKTTETLSRLETKVDDLSLVVTSHGVTLKQIK